MASSFMGLVNPGVAGLAPYIPGRPAAELENVFPLDKALNLASNENTLGPSTKVLRAVRAATGKMHLYPDGSTHDLRIALAEHYGVGPERLFTGNGSNDVLVLLAQSFLSERTSAIYSEHAFVVYALATQMCGAKSLVAKARAWGHDLQAMSALVRDDTRMLFIANPNNPTGSWVTHGALHTLLKALPRDILVVVDEAYYEYVSVDDYPDCLSLQADFPNLVITRSFSKIYGLAGLRVGYAIADPEIVGVLDRVRQPFNVNQLAQTAAIAALQDQEHVVDSRAMNSAGLVQVVKGLGSLGVSALPSVGNFVCFEVPKPLTEERLYMMLLERGVIIRMVGKVYDMPGYMRVTVSTSADNRVFLRAFGQCIDDAA